MEPNPKFVQVREKLMERARQDPENPKPRFELGLLELQHFRRPHEALWYFGQARHRDPHPIVASRARQRKTPAVPGLR